MTAQSSRERIPSGDDSGSPAYEQEPSVAVIESPRCRHRHTGKLESPEVGHQGQGEEKDQEGGRRRDYTHPAQVESTSDIAFKETEPTLAIVPWSPMVPTVFHHGRANHADLTAGPKSPWVTVEVVGACAARFLILKISQ